MTCTLIIMGLQAFNPCDVVALKPHITSKRTDEFIPTFERVQTNHCTIYLNDGSRHGIYLIINDTPCSVIANKINQTTEGTN